MATWARAPSDPMERHNHPLLTAAVVIALVAGLPLAFAGPLDSEEPKAANKTAAAADDTQYLSADFADTDLGVTILSSMIKTSSPTDLLVQVSLECALWTEVLSSTVDEHPEGYTAYGRAEARVEIWIELDGVAIPLGDSDGHVTFCDRVHEQEIFDIDESTGNFTIRQYLETKTANAFNWFTLDVGSGVHTIAVKADIEADSTDGSWAEGAIGARTLIVEPTRFPNA